jgi:hypothetical protein
MLRIWNPGNADYLGSKLQNKALPGGVSPEGGVSVGEGVQVLQTTRSSARNQPFRTVSWNSDPSTTDLTGNQRSPGATELALLTGGQGRTTCSSARSASFPPTKAPITVSPDSLTATGSSESANNNRTENDEYEDQIDMLYLTICSGADPCH